MLITFIINGILKAIICANHKTGDCYATNTFSKFFCYYTKDESKKDDKCNHENDKPLHALILSIQTILFLIATVVIGVYSFGYNITANDLKSGGIGALAIGFLFKTQFSSMLTGARLFFRNGFNIGDWVEIPELNIDGSIEEITSFSVVVKNWDNTKTNIPIENFTNKIYKNWRHIKEDGGRRIKKSILIDQKTIKELSSYDIEKLKTNLPSLEEYLNKKKNDVDKYNKNNKIKRNMTNIGTFRAYIELYLNNLEDTRIHKDLTTIVRLLSPTEHGIPFEIYTFTNDTEWKKYEDIQSDIFDFLLSSINKFDLEVYQVS